MQFTASDISRTLRGLLLFAALLGAGSGQAALISLFEIDLNVDGDVFFGDEIAGAADADGFDFGTGLGVIELTVSGPGTHQVALFVDHEIDEAINTFFNETGSVAGVPSGGQSWEIDEPGYCPLGGLVCGDIFDNFADFGFFAGAGLDNTNAVAGLQEDVSMALAWTVDLLDDEIARITFNIADVLPNAPFFLGHSDPESGAALYFHSSLEVSAVTAPVPEPAGPALLLAGLASLAAVRFRRKRRQSSHAAPGTSSGAINR